MAFNGHVTANDLDEQQLFFDIPEVARIIGRDACVESGDIPGQKFGARWSVPTSWVRQQAGEPEPSPDLDAIADQVAAQVVARLARLLAAARPEHDATA